MKNLKNTPILCMGETQCIEKNGSTASSFLLEFLRNCNCHFDQLILFSDNSASQIKSHFLVSVLAVLTARNDNRCRSVRLCLMVFGHTKFQPGGRSRLLKRSLLHQNFGFILDVEEAVLYTVTRENTSALGNAGYAHVTIWTHCPFQCYSVDLINFVTK